MRVCLPSDLAAKDFFCGDLEDGALS
jgi:hypothetical protein